MRILPVASIAALVILLSGCSPQPVAPEPLTRAHRTMAPGFASEAEALAAAEAAYASYLAMSDLIASEGGANPERIAPFVTEEWLAKELESFAEFESSGRRQVGSSTLKSATIQRSDPDRLVAYMCVDLSATRIVDSVGVDVTSSARPIQLTVEASFNVVGVNVLLAGNEPWSGESAC